MMHFRSFLIKKIQDRYIFQKNRLNSPSAAVDFNSAKKIGILFKGSGKDDTDKMFSFASELRNQGKEVSVISYFQGKDENMQQPDHEHEMIITREDFNFLQMPKKGKTEFFLNEKFDLLINFCQGSCFPLYYMASVSNAHMKTGNYNPDFGNIYDVMFEVKDDATAEDFIKQFNKYIKLIFKS